MYFARSDFSIIFYSNILSNGEPIMQLLDRVLRLTYKYLKIITENLFKTYEAFAMQRNGIFNLPGFWSHAALEITAQCSLLIDDRTSYASLIGLSLIFFRQRMNVAGYY